MRVSVTMVLVALLSGCADSHQWLPQQSGSTHLDRADKIYISTPFDGSYGNHTYAGSGRNTAQIIYSAFSRHSAAVTVGSSTSNLEQALEGARRSGQDYVVLPTILHWEDRATEWSMIPDKVEVKIEVVQVSSGAVVGSGIAKGASGLSTLGGDHPQDLLPEPIETFVSSLY